MGEVVPFSSPTVWCPECGQPLSEEEMPIHDCDLARHYCEAILRRNGSLRPDGTLRPIRRLPAWVRWLADKYHEWRFGF